MARKQPQLEVRRLQQVVMNSSSRYFLQEVNGLLLDGWFVVPGSYYHTRVLAIADEKTPRHFVDDEGYTCRDHFFIALEREEHIDPDAAKRLIQSLEQRELAEFGVA